MTETKSHPIPISVDANHVDYIVGTLKGVVGAAPFIGPLIAEAIGALIPNQRLDRLTRFVQILDAKLEGIDRSVINAHLATPAYLDLLEDSIYQAVRALTEERLEHIAEILKNGLTDEEQNIEQYKHLLQILSQLTDAQIIILQSYHYTMAKGNEEFFETHRDLLMAAGAARLGSNQETIDRSIIHKDYRQHLVRLSLLQPRFKKPKKGALPEFDERTGMIKASGYQLTPLGRLLLQNLDISESGSPF